MVGWKQAVWDVYFLTTSQISRQDTGTSPPNARSGSFYEETNQKQQVFNYLDMANTLEKDTTSKQTGIHREYD